MLESFEKVPVKIYKDVASGSNAVAAQIATLIKEKQAEIPYQYPSGEEAEQSLLKSIEKEGENIESKEQEGSKKIIIS